MLYCIFALYHDRNTVDWAPWRHKIIAQRGPTLRSCIGARAQVLHWAPHLLGHALGVTSGLLHVPLFMDGSWLLPVSVKTAVDLQLLQTRCIVSTRNGQVKTSVRRIKFGDSTANVTLFNSWKVFLFWKVCSWLRVICILTKACSFASWQILR